MSADIVVGSLVCVAMPPDTRITGLDGDLRIPLRAGTWLRIGAVAKRHDVVVRTPTIPTSQASLIIIVVDDDGGCHARDSGHNFTVRVNDHEVPRTYALVHGDIIEPCLDEPLGLRFRFETA